MTDEPEKDELTMVEPPKPGGAKSVPVGHGGIELKHLEDVVKFARYAVSGGAVPKGMNEGAAVIAIEAGLERGLGPMGGLTLGTVINGRFSWNGQGCIALIQNSGKCKPGTLKHWTEGEGLDAIGYAAAHRVGYADPDVRTFSVKDARQAGLWGKSGPWTHYPLRQLAWRAMGHLARDVFPDVLGGFPLETEAADYTDEAPATAPKADILTAEAPKVADPLLSAIAGIPGTIIAVASDDEPEPKPAPEADETPAPSDEPAAVPPEERDPEEIPLPLEGTAQTEPPDENEG